MKKLEKMYEHIFNDQNMRELFTNFHTKKWKTLNKEEKLEIISEINTGIANIYGFSPLTIKEDNRSKNSYASQDSFNWDININTRSLEKDNGYEVIDSYFHELRHSFQHRAIANKLTSKESVSKEEINNWKINFLPGNYFNVYSEYYLYQPVERDAWIHGMLFAKMVYLSNLNKSMGEDREWKKYCSAHSNVIKEFISDNESSLKMLESIDSKIKDIYNSKNEDVEQSELGAKYALEYMSNRDNLGYKEIATLISPYAYQHLDNEQKVYVINKYREFLNVPSKRKYTIRENTVSSITIKGKKHYLNDSLNLINIILSDSYSTIVNKIVSSNKNNFKLKDEVVEELRLNLYKNKEGKMINFIKDSENLFMFSIQPYAKYESLYVLSEFKKLMDVEKEMYKKNYSGWNFWLGFYDNDLIFKTASEVMELPFEVIYSEQLEKYRKKIDDDRNQRIKQG